MQEQRLVQRKQSETVVAPPVAGASAASQATETAADPHHHSDVDARPAHDFSKLRLHAEHRGAETVVAARTESTPNESDTAEEAEHDSQQEEGEPQEEPTRERQRSSGAAFDFSRIRVIPRPGETPALQPARDVSPVHAVGPTIQRKPDGSATLPPPSPTATVPPNASPPAPNASTMPNDPDPEAAHFEGKTLRFDRSVLVKIVTDLSTEKGVMAPHDFANRFGTLSPGALVLGGVIPPNARPNLYEDLKRGLADANMQLDHDQEEYTNLFETRANGVAGELLAKSEETIKAELGRLGITGDVIRGPGGGVPDFKLSNTGAATAMREAARMLVPLAKTLDTCNSQSAAAFNKYGEASRDDPFGLMTRPIQEEWQAKQKRAAEAAETYEKERRTRIAEHPSLAMYADQPGAAQKLGDLANAKDEDLANNIGTSARDKLSKIKAVKEEIGKRFSVWSQPHLRRVTLDAMGASPLQREVVDRKVHQKQRAEADDKMFFSLLAIGLGLLAAIPTGGGSLILTGIAAAAGAAGAALSLYQLGEESQRNALAVAANGTDFDKAKAISQNEPDSLGLALSLVTTAADVFAAAAAFKALNGIFKAAKAGDVQAAIKLSSAAENVGVKGAARQKIVGEAVAGLKDEAIEATGKTMAGSGTRGEYLQKMLAGVAEHSQFKGELQEAAKFLEHVQGRIPEHAKELVNTGKVRVFSEASLIDVYGLDAGKARWAQYAYADGFYSSTKDLVFIRSGNSPEDLAGILIHEATHRVGNANPLRGNNFMSEAVAEFAERDFYITLYHEGGPLAGRPVTSKRIKSFLDMDDAEMMIDIERRYYEAKKDVAFIQKASETPEKVVEQIFQDIAADYKARLPKSP